MMLWLLFFYLIIILFVYIKVLKLERNVNDYVNSNKGKK